MTTAAAYPFECASGRCSVSFDGQPGCDEEVIQKILGLNAVIIALPVVFRLMALEIIPGRSMHGVDELPVEMDRVPPP